MLTYSARYALIFIIGILVGRVLNKIIDRAEKEEKSACYKEEINSSYVKERTKTRYIMVGVFTGIIFIFCFWSLGFTVKAIYGCVLSSILICISIIDYDIMEIPDYLTIAVAIIGALGLFVFMDINLKSRILGAVIISVPMYTLNKFIKDAFGEGDVFLIAACGLVLGLEKTLVAMFVAIILGGICAAALIIRGKAKKRSHISFGQYICIGTMVALIYGDKILKMYLSFFGL